MRRAVLAVLIVVGLAPEGRAGREVETWVGAWTGTATWKGCTVEGGRELEVSVSWHDGALWIDGAAVYEGLGEIAPEVRDGGVLVHDGDGVTVELKPGKARGRATLAFETAAGCAMTARLERGGTGIAACDDLVALASVAGACSLEVDDLPSDEPGGEIDGWRALRKAKERKRAARSCTARAGALRERLVAADCIPPEDDPADLAECRVVWRIAQQLLRCGHLPVEHKQQTMESMAAFRRSLRTIAGKEGGAELAATQCQETAGMLKDIAEAAHCKL
jgi:hypothetical protein